MNRHDSTNPDTERVARMRALIERSSLGEEGARLLASRTPDKQVDRIKQRLARLRRDVTVDDAQNTSTDTTPAPAPAEKQPDLAEANPCASKLSDNEPRTQEFDLVIHSRPIMLTPSQRVRSNDFETYLVLMYDAAGAFAWITTPVSSRADARKYRFSTIAASRWRIENDFVKQSFSIASDCLNRQPSSRDIFDILDAWAGLECVRGSNRRTHERFVSHVEHCFNTPDDSPLTPRSTWWRDAFTLVPDMVGPLSSRASGSASNKPVEALVITINQQGVGLTAELREGSYSYLYDAIQKVLPVTKSFVNDIAPQFRKELQQIMRLMEPGKRVAKSWSETLDRDRMHDIVRVFSEIIRNTNGIQSIAVDPILNIHLEELDPQPKSFPGVIDSVWRSETPEEEVSNDDSNCSICP